MDGVDDLFEDGPAFGAEDFEEGRVGFESRRIGSRGFYKTQAKVKGRRGIRLFKVGDIWVKANT